MEFQHDVEAGCHGFLPLTWDQLRQLQASGIEIGSHTRTHFDCGSHNINRLTDEIAGSKAELESELGRSIEVFSFPFGYPGNISEEAASIALRTYPYIFSAFGGSNVSPLDGTLRHLKRWCHLNHLWDLELCIHGVLEIEPPFALPANSQDVSRPSFVAP